MTYSYAKKPWESKPTLLVLYTLVEGPTGQPFALFREVQVLGKLNKWELTREGEKLEMRAESVERGEKQPAHVDQFDIRKTPFWGNYLRKNPDLLKRHPELMNDLVTAGEDPECSARGG